jgi:hypothetical protein
MKNHLITISIAFIFCLNTIYGQTNAELISKIRAAKVVEELPAMTVTLQGYVDVYKVVKKYNEILNDTDKLWQIEKRLNKGEVITIYGVYYIKIDQNEKVSKYDFSIGKRYNTALISKSKGDSARIVQFMPSFRDMNPELWKVWDGRRDTLVRKAEYQRYQSSLK